MNKKNGTGAAGKILTLLLLVMGAGVMYVMYKTGMVPVKYLILIGAGALILTALVGFLTWNFYHRGRFVIGLFLWFAVMLLFVVAAIYVRQTHSTISEITSADKEVSRMGVFVKAENTASSLEETAGFGYGILRDLDRSNTDAALEQVGSTLGAVPAVTEYEGLTELVNALVSDAAGAIILNEAYLDVIRELDGFANLDSMIKEIDSRNVETEVPKNPVSSVSSGGEETEAEKSASGNDEASSAAEPAAVPDNTNKDVMVVYISGIDNRGGIVAKSRSDVNIVLVANMKTKQMLLINTPRDYFVPLSISNGAPDKLTHAGIYGINVCMDTLGMLYNVKIPYYVKVNFQGFIDIINSLGGIDVWSDYEFDSKNELGWHYTKGMNHMDGEAALTFARERFSFAEGDRQRGKNQMAVIKGIMTKAVSTDLIRNYSSILKSLEGSFETNISYDEIARILMKQLEEGGTWNLVTYSVNGTGDTQKPYSLSTPAYVMIPDQATVDTAKNLISQVINGGVLQQINEDAAPLLSPEEADAIAAEANGLVTPTPASDGTAGAVAPAGTAPAAEAGLPVAAGSPVAAGTEAVPTPAG